MSGLSDTAAFEQWKLEQKALERPCQCGSGLERHALNDARGLFCGYVCDKCEDEVKAQYRPEIFKRLRV